MIWEVESTDEAVEKAFEKAVMTGTEFDEVPELLALREQAYKEIEQEQNENYSDNLLEKVFEIAEEDPPVRKIISLINESLEKS